MKSRPDILNNGYGYSVSTVKHKNKFMRKYWIALFLVSLLLMILGFVSGKITGDSFSYISLSGFIFAVLKILIITLTISIAATITIPALVADILMVIVASYNFMLVPAIWDIVWDQYTMSWFWHTTSGSSLFFATLILLIVMGLLYRRKA